MLVLAVHSFEQVTAKVPFSVILLQDLVTNKKTGDFKCRQMVPTSGSRSTSIWDVPDPEALLQWLNENVNVDCTHEIFEVQEEFSIGLMGEVQRARAAEKVAAGARDLGQRTASVAGQAASAVSHQAQEIDQKLKISERAAATATAVKESAVARSTVAFFGKAGSAMKSATTKVVDNERVASATHAIGSSFKRLGHTLSNKGRVNTSEDDASPMADQVPQYARPAAEYEVPGEQAALRNPSTTSAPPATTQPARIVDPTPASPPPETVAFTLDDSEAGPTPIKQ